MPAGLADESQAQMSCFIGMNKELVVQPKEVFSGCSGYRNINFTKTTNPI